MLTFTLLVFALAWTVKATPVGNHTCTGVVKHPVTVRVNVTEPVTFRSYTWCLKVPPRCSQYTIQLKDRIKIHTEIHNRTITVCCAGYVEIDYTCVPACPPQTECPYMHCNRTNHCYCTPGYTGLYCSQPCPKGVWGAACQKPCDCPLGYTCHHLTGDCMLDDSPSTKPKRTTIMTYATEQSTISTSLPRTSTTKTSTMGSTTRTLSESVRITTQTTTTTMLSTKVPSPTEPRLTSISPPSTRPYEITLTTPSTSTQTITTATGSSSSPVDNSRSITSATTPSTIVSIVTLSPAFKELPKTPVTTRTTVPPQSTSPSTSFTVSSWTYSTGLKDTERSSIAPETTEQPEKSEAAPDLNFFAPTSSEITTPSLQPINTEIPISLTPFAIPRTPPTSHRTPLSILETPPSILEETRPSIVQIPFSITVPTNPPIMVHKSSMVPSSTSQIIPRTEATRTTLFVPFWMKISPPTPTLTEMKTETTMTQSTPRTPPYMHIISKTSDGRLVLTNVVETSSTINVTTKKANFTYPPFTSFNLPTSTPPSTTRSVWQKILALTTEHVTPTSVPSTTLRPHIPERNKSYKDVTLVNQTVLEQERPTSTVTSSAALATKPPTSTNPTITPFTTTLPSTTSSIITTTVQRTSPTNTSPSTEMSPTTSATKKPQTPSNATISYPTISTTATSADASDNIKTYLPKFNFDKDDSLEITKILQKPTKLKEKIQKKYKSKIDTTSTVSTSYPSSGKVLDENLTNNVFLETTEFKVHLGATKSIKNTDTPVRKATTKLDISEEDPDSTRLSKKKIKDKFAKVLEESSSRPPITLFVSPSTGANAAHTWYSHIREKAKVKSNVRQLKTTTPLHPTETSPMSEESNDIDSLAAMYTASQDAKNGNSLQDEFNLPRAKNPKYNSSVAFAAAQAARSGSFDFYSSITAVIGGCLLVLACLVLVTLLLFRRRNKRRLGNGDAMLAADGVHSYETVYPVRELSGALEAVTFFCPTFTNNYAENMKRDASQFQYDQPKCHVPEPLYAEIRH